MSLLSMVQRSSSSLNLSSSVAESTSGGLAKSPLMARTPRSCDTAQPVSVAVVMQESSKKARILQQSELDAPICWAEGPLVGSLNSARHVGALQRASQIEPPALSSSVWAAPTSAPASPHALASGAPPFLPGPQARGHRAHKAPRSLHAFEQHVIFDERRKPRSHGHSPSTPSWGQARGLGGLYNAPRAGSAISTRSRASWHADATRLRPGAGSSPSSLLGQATRAFCCSSRREPQANVLGP